MEHFSRAGLVFDVSDEGPEDGETVLLLHGWPQDHTAWRHVAPLLHAAGLRTLAPDQRGYSPGARPRGRAAYGMGQLVADAVALLDAAGVTRAHVVGHDWGGSVAWALAERHPERVSSLTVLSTPHHHAMGWAMRHGDQLRRSWYMFAFQLPVLPEAVLRRRLPAVLRRSGLPEEDVLRYVARFRQPGAATSCLAWYRGMPIGAALPRLLPVGRGQGRARPTGPHRRITVPTTYVWGRRDPALGRDAALRTERWVASDYRFVELDAGHWLPERVPEVVSAEVRRRAGVPESRP